jgi:hypothetical protein
MKLKTSVIASLEEEDKYFEYLRMKMEDQGLRIQAKSPSFAKWFNDQSQGVLKVKATNPWSGGAYHNICLENIKGVNGYIYPDDYSFFHDGTPNLLWMVHKELEGGFDLLVKQTISLNNFEDYFSQCCEAVRDLYTTYLRKASLEASFSELREKAK